MFYFNKEIGDNGPAYTNNEINSKKSQPWFSALLHLSLTFQNNVFLFFGITTFWTSKI